MPVTGIPLSFLDLARWLDDTIDKRESGVLICFDDVGCHPDLIDQIEETMFAAPSNVEFIVAMTADIGFARIKAQRQLIEVTADALAFTLVEAKTLARITTKGLISDAGIDALWKRTEGWPAPTALLLHAASPSASPNNRVLPKKVSGRDRDLDKYFRSVILAPLPKYLQEFCIRASVLGAISADYFDELFGGHDGAYCIDKLAAERMLLRPLDRNQSAYAFHPLFREFLEHRYAVDYHGLDPKLWKRAADWQQRRGNSSESISLYLRAGDKRAAAEVASASITDIAFRQGGVEQIRSWQDSLSDTDNTPTIILGLAWAQIFSLGQAQAASLIASLDTLGKDATDAASREQLEWWRDLVSAIAHATADDLVESQRQCELWLRQYPDADLVCTGAILTCLSFIAASQHRFDDLADLSTQAASVNAVAEQQYALGWLRAAMIFSEIERGRLRIGASLLQTARNDEPKLGDNTAFSTNLLDLLDLEIRYESNQLDGISAQVEVVLDFVRQHGVVDFIFSAFRTAAAIAELGGDRQRAIGLLQEARVIASEHGFPRLNVLAQLALADLWVVSSADEAMAMLPARDDPAFLTPHGPELRARRSLSEARIAAQQGKFHLSKRFASATLEHARRHRSGRLEISALVCFAAANAIAEQQATAEQLMADAVDVASRRGCFRTLLDERRFLRALGSAAASLMVLIPNDNDLCTSDGQQAALRSSTPNPTEKVLLSRKELALLHRVKEGLSNRGIADKHRISEDTVKWHLHNIYKKLAVRNRVQAILKADGMGIFD